MRWFPSAAHGGRQRRPPGALCDILKLIIKLRFRGCTFYSENSGIKRNIPVPLWAECKNTKQPYGGKESMENTDKNTFKNMMGKLAVLPESNIKIQSDDEFDFKIFRCLQRRTFYSLSKNKMVQSKKYRIGRMNYIVNSCFEIEPQNTVDNGIRYLLGMEMQDGKVS